MMPGLDALGALTDPTRRAVYEVVASAGPSPVSRDDVVAALGVGRTLAAFHLDKLVEAGLLEASYARRTGRSGPGAGRTAKLYRRTSAEHTASVPPRTYRGAAEILAEAIDRTGADEAVFAVAREQGRTQAVVGQDLVAALAARGYEPVAVGDGILLRNCPFHRLAEEFPPLVCGMNLALLQGLLDGAGLHDWRATTEPSPGHCCVKLSKTKFG